MDSILEVLKSVLENRRDDIVNDVNLTNDIIIDDVMCSLGYNMKRDRAVKRIYNSTIDWEVKGKDGEKCFIVKTVALGNDITDNDLNEAFSFGEKHGYPFIVIANGETFKIFAFFNYENKYILIDELDINRESTEKLDNLFESLKKKSYSKNEIYKLFYDNYLDDIKVKAMLLESIDSIVEVVDSNIKLFDTTKLKAVTEHILTDKDVISSEELLKANEKIQEANNEIQKAKEELQNSNNKLTEQKELLDAQCKQLEELNEYLLSLTDERDKLFAEKEDIRLKLEELENTITNSGAEQSEQEDSLENNKSSADSDTSEADENNPDLDSDINEQKIELEAILEDIQNREITLKNKEEELSNKIAELSNKVEEITAREEELNTLEHNLTVKEKDLSLREADITSREHEIANKITKTNDIITDNEDDEDNFLGLSDATNINKENANNEDNHTDNDIVASLKKENEELRIKIVQLETDIDILNKKNKTVLDELLASKVELDKIKTAGEVAESGEQGLINDDLVKKIGELEAKEESMTAYNAQLVQEINDLKFKLSLVDNPEAFTNEKIKELENERNALKAEQISLLSSVDDFKKAKDEAEERENRYKFEAEERIQKLKDRVKKLEDESNFRSYEQQINDLTEERDTASEEIKRLNRKVAKLTEELDVLSGGEVARANELLDMIIVAPGQPETFAGVINTELYQNQDLRRFVGLSLQKLHQLKLNEAFDYIWDGDMFTFKQKDIKDSPHCILSGKGYDIVNEELTPLIALSKLKVIFSHFDDLVFECRLVSSSGYKNVDELRHDAMREDVLRSSGITLDKDNTYDEQSYSNEEFNNDTFEQYVENQELDENAYTEEPFNNEQYIDENQYTDNSFNSEYQEESFNNQYPEESFNNEQYIDENQYTDDSFNSEYDNNTLETKLYVTELLSYQDLMMGDRNIVFEELKYIGTDTSAAFEITESSDLNKVLCKCIDAILAMEEFDGHKSVANIKNIDFNDISRFISRFTPDKNGSAKISGTKFCVTDIDNIYDLVETLCIVCEKLNINMQSWFIYITGKTEDEYFEPWETSPNAVGTVYALDVDENYTKKESALVIKGSIIGNTITTKNSLEYRRKLFGKPLGIKTEYMSQKILGYKEYLDSIRLVAQAYINNGNSLNELDKCTTIDGLNCIISGSTDNLREDYDEVIVSGTKMYVSKIDEWEQAETIVRMHVTLFGDIKIAVKTIVDIGYYEFLRDQFFTSEPSLELSIASLVNYIESTNSK